MAYVPITGLRNDPQRGDDATFAEGASLESMIVSVVRIGRPVVVDMRECNVHGLRDDRRVRPRGNRPD